MASKGSITCCIGQLKQGDQEAARVLWQRYFYQVVGLARKKLGGVPRRAADEEDVAVSAMGSFFRGAKEGQFSRLEDRDDLWCLLGAITAHKAIDLAHHEGAQKRGCGGVEPRPDLDQVIGPGLTPELAAQVAEEFQRRLDRLSTDELRAVALWSMDGYTNDEIAAKLNCVRRTVERKLERIRAEWQEEPGR